MNSKTEEQDTDVWSTGTGSQGLVYQDSKHQFTVLSF